MSTYKKEQRWELRYAVPTAGGSESEKVIYPRSEAKRAENLEACKKYGYRVISCKKLYPFNTERNQHNFELIANICSNRMYDMEAGAVKFNLDEYDRLSETREKAQNFFALPLPLAWLPWEEWKEAKELSETAILHRQNACIANGRLDLVTFC